MTFPRSNSYVSTWSSLEDFFTLSTMSPLKAVSVATGFENSNRKKQAIMQSVGKEVKFSVLQNYFLHFNPSQMLV